MAWIEIVAAGAVRVVPLPASAVLGRGEPCTYRLADPRVPSLWVEVRWFPESDRWAWRPLRDPDYTEARRNRAAGLPFGWYTLEAGGALALVSAVSVRLRDADPPERFAVDLDTGDALLGPALAEVVGLYTCGAWPADAEDRSVETPKIADGTLFTVGERRFRYFDASPPVATNLGGIDLRRPGSELSVVRGLDGTWRLIVTEGRAEVDLDDPPVRILVPYVEARVLEDADFGGWLARIDVHQRWVELGGDPTSPESRVGVDRSRLLVCLEGRGVGGAEALFDPPEKRQGRYYVRCAIPPERLRVVT